MRRIAFPSADLPGGLAALRDALPEADALTAQEEALLTDLYEGYVAARGQAHALSSHDAFTEQRADAFRKAYKLTHSGRRLAYVRTRLRSLVENRCPSCGSSRPTHLDHHAPKETFPGFSLLLMNLVCSCDGCNGRKGSGVPASEAEAFMHPYFDDVPDVRYVRVDLVWEGAGVRAALTFDDAAAIPDPVMKARMRHQYDRVDAGGQVADEAIEVIKEEADNIAGEYPGAEAEAVAAYLSRRAVRLERRHGAGYWKAALLATLSTDVPFCSGGYSVLLRPATRTSAIPKA